MNSARQTPRSLLSYFAPPEDFVGVFGWLCGFSADARFLNEAMNAFTGLSMHQRMHMGEIRLALMLDPGEPALLPTAVPGLSHLPLRDPTRRPFRLMHAKVGLLGYRHEQDATKWCVRLVVSTGNWTRQTVEDSLDVACEVEVSSDQVGPDHAQECADIKAATKFFGALRELYDTRLLGAGTPLSGGDAAEDLATWLRSCARSRNNPDALPPRFVDNRRHPLLNEILDRARAQHCRPNDYLAMGSGFYEGQPNGSGSGCARPTVPLNVVRALKSANLLKERCLVELHVEPSACQSISTSVDYLGEHPDHAIAVHAAVPPKSLYGESSSRTLHAKFLFCANRSKRTGACNNAWLYIGSGNFTPAGMMVRMSQRGGNLEAGMVLFPQGLFWEDAGKGRFMVQDRLPIGGPPLKADAPNLASGEAWQPRGAENFAAPLAFLLWRVEGVLAVGQQGEPLSLQAEDAEVLDEWGEACPRVPSGYAWSGTTPRMARMRWRDAGVVREAWVPVIDEFGRVAATPLGSIELVEAEQQLLSFPGTPEPEGPDSEMDEDDAEGGSGKPEARRHAGGRLVSQGAAIRQMMGMLERIALRQVEVSAADWPRWCVRLEQTLSQIRDSSAVTQFVAMGLNPLSPLRAVPFRPSFAEDPTGEAAFRYSAVLNRLEQAWKTNGLANLEGSA